MAQVNGLDQHSVHFETRDLFAITPEFMAAQRPDLILLLEVLEHLNDPVAALRAATGPAPRKACVLISVPWAGRLEECKGHVSFFNVDRLQWMCRQTGLNVHFVESVYDTWTFVLASHAAKIPERVVSLYEAMIDKGTPAAEAPSGMFATRTSRTCDRAARRFEPVSFADSTTGHKSHWKYRTRSVTVNHAGLSCDVQGGDDDGKGQYGGIKFHVQSAKALRLVLSLDNPQNIQQVLVDGYDAAKRRVIRWTWRPSGILDRRIGPIECLLDPRRAASPFVLTDGADLDRVHEVHVFVRIHPGTRVGLLLHQAETAR